MDFERVVPATNRRLRETLYEGALFRLPASPASVRLVAQVRDFLDAELGSDPRRAQFRLSDEAFFGAVGRLRLGLYREARFRRGVMDLMEERGFRTDDNAFEPPRLRTIAHRGHDNPRAAAIYYGHRDTWYAHSQALINWWLPLDDLPESQTFVFFPDCFRRAVTNDSETFDYDTWVAEDAGRRIGWQDREAGRRALYPRALAEPGTGPTVGFACRAAEVIMFSGAHLHRTLENTSGATRFSIDFRTVSLDDHRRGIGAPNVDNRSTGSALRHYVVLDRPDAGVEP